MIPIRGNRPCLCNYALGSAWNVDAEKLSVWSGSDACGMTVLLDGFPVANWQPDLGKEKEADIELRPEGAGRFCQPVKVAPGLHTLQFLAVQGQGQNISAT